MRLKRVETFRRYRYKKLRKLVFLVLLLPCCILLGYVITSLVILPAIVK